MGVCCTTNNEEITKEIKKDARISEFETKDTEHIISLFCFNEERKEHIVFEVKDNPLEDFSKSIFQKLNEMRSNPIIYYDQSTQYYLNDLISEAVSQKIKPKELTWSTKKAKQINDYFQSSQNKMKSIKQKINDIRDFFAKDYSVYGYSSFGDINNIEKRIWTLLSSCNQSHRRKIFLCEYSYCVIYSDVCTKNESVYSFLFFFKSK